MCLVKSWIKCRSEMHCGACLWIQDIKQPVWPVNCTDCEIMVPNVWWQIEISFFGSYFKLIDYLIDLIIWLYWVGAGVYVLFYVLLRVFESKVHL